MGGRAYNFRAAGLVTALDGTVSAEACYIVPAYAISGIDAQVEPGTAGNLGLWAGTVALQYFSGAVWNTSTLVWAGGAWTTFWSAGITSGSDAAGGGQISAGMVSKSFIPPILIPRTFVSELFAPVGHPKAGQSIPANTHNAAEVVGEWDLRAIFVANAGSGTGFGGVINVQVPMND